MCLNTSMNLMLCIPILSIGTTSGSSSSCGSSGHGTIIQARSTWTCSTMHQRTTYSRTSEDTVLIPSTWLKEQKSKHSTTRSSGVCKWISRALTNGRQELHWVEPLVHANGTLLDANKWEMPSGSFSLWTLTLGITSVVILVTRLPLRKFCNMSSSRIQVWISDVFIGLNCLQAVNLHDWFYLQ